MFQPMLFDFLHDPPQPMPAAEPAAAVTSDGDSAEVRCKACGSAIPAANVRTLYRFAGLVRGHYEGVECLCPGCHVLIRFTRSGGGDFLVKPHVVRRPAARAAFLAAMPAATVYAA